MIRKAFNDKQKLDNVTSEDKFLNRQNFGKINSVSDNYTNMTKQLVLALSPQTKQKNEHYLNIDDDNYLSIENPKNFLHLFQILFRTNIKQTLGLSNPDGFFYLQY